ncbi:hypothetical protein [Niallia endozanthoxylica]|uniref:Uncharacterized protein n=1 Tax=Niallia endozanthoxylica TaxID=2036016 RepID=A0A5J5I470_9BACI|nr:hypothetical protein [Niallia endozanthoxylica]KAA9029958.1 hypothetical protein F4V44_02840 [Niallia endozanthoxylica]
MTEIILLLGFAILPLVLSVFLQKKIIQSNKAIVLKSIGNFILLALVQTILLVGFIFMQIAMFPDVAEATAGWLFVAYVIYSPFVLIFNLIVILVAHRMLRKRM